VKAPRSEVLRRLRSIEGHIGGIRKMVEEDAYCVDILQQTHAVKRALEKLEAVLVRGHLGSCIGDALRPGRRAEVVRELEEIFDMSRR
jgi:DNA-binding FrmR family transcriptional regulator